MYARRFIQVRAHPNEGSSDVDNIHFIPENKAPTMNLSLQKLFEGIADEDTEF